MDIGKLLAVINQTGDRAVRGINHLMIEEAEIMQKLAISFAPVDVGNLEAAIKMQHDRGGQNGRTQVRVYVDVSMPAPSFNADGSVTKGTEHKTVGDYVMLMHEGLAPYGSGLFDLGPKSAQKGAGVGGKFMERAFKARKKSIMAAARAIVKGVTR